MWSDKTCTFLVSLQDLWSKIQTWMAKWAETVKSNFWNCSRKVFGIELCIKLAKIQEKFWSSINHTIKPDIILIVIVNQFMTRPFQLWVTAVTSPPLELNQNLVILRLQTNQMCCYERNLLQKRLLDAFWVWTEKDGQKKVSRWNVQENYAHP